VGYNSHIFWGIYWGGGLRNFLYTRPLFNKKLWWDITVIYFGAFIWVGDWEILYIQDLYLIIARVGYNIHIFKDIYWGGEWEILFIQQDLYLKKARVGYNSNVFRDIYWGGDWEILYIQQYLYLIKS